LDKFGFKWVVLRESFLTTNGRYIHNNFDVLKQLKAIAPTVVITDGFNPTSLYAFFYAWWHGCKHICTTDGTLASEHGLSAIHRVLRRFIFKRSATFIGASDGSLQLYRSYGLPDDRLFKSCLCTDNERFRDARSQAKRFDLLFCGRLTHEKHPLFAIDVAEKLSALLGRQVSLLFVGSGDLERRLRDRAADAASVNISFHGFATQADLPALYGSARVFLFPTLRDVWGVVASEALAAGLPIVSTPFAGAVDEIIQHGVNGFVHRLDVDEWARAAQHLLTDERLYEEFSRNSLRLVAGHNYEAAAAGFISASLSSLDRAP
jgi:glycosyltransferase involved in cell wall biosynthesis